MIAKVVLVPLVAVFLAQFIARNRLVQKRLGRSIVSRDPLVLSTIVLSSAAFILSILSAWWAGLYEALFSVRAWDRPLLQGIGTALFALGILVAWAASAGLKDSWRVGLPSERTELITGGIYSRVRNPYFLSYFMIYLSLFLLRPNLVLLGVIALLAANFHLLVLREESYLAATHGRDYERYRKRAGRYLPRLF